MGTLNKTTVLQGARFDDHPLNNTPEKIGGASTRFYASGLDNSGNSDAHSFFKLYNFDAGALDDQAPSVGTTQPDFCYRLQKGGVEDVIPIAFNGSAVFGMANSAGQFRWFAAVTTTGGQGSNAGPAATVTASLFTDGN